MRSRHHRPDVSIDPTSGHGFVIGYQGSTDPKAIDNVNRVDDYGEGTISAYLILLQKM